MKTMQPDKISVLIDYKVTYKDSLNTIYAGIHFSKRQKFVDFWRYFIKYEFQDISVKPFAFPVNVTIRYGSNLDIDNHGFLSKLIIDGLKNTLLRDDSKKWVQKLTQEFLDEQEKIEIILEPANPEDRFEKRRPGRPKSKNANAKTTSKKKTPKSPPDSNAVKKKVA